MIDIRSYLQKVRSDSFSHLLQPENENLEIGYKTRIKLDFTNYMYKFISHDNGFIQFDSISFDFINCIGQSKMTFDKTESFDFALIVENFISKQKNFVSKPKIDSKIKLSEPIETEKSKTDKSEILQPNSLIKISTEHYIDFEFKKETKIIKTKDMTINLADK